MDLIKCRNCPQHVWVSQRTCPNCGARVPLWRGLWSFARGEGRLEAFGAVVIVVGMAVGLLGAQQIGGGAASAGVILFFVGRFTRRLKQRMYTRRR